MKKRFEHIFTRVDALSLLLHNLPSTKEVAAFFFFFNLCFNLVGGESKRAVGLSSIVEEERALLSEFFFLPLVNLHSFFFFFKLFFVSFFFFSAFAKLYHRHI